MKILKAKSFKIVLYVLLIYLIATWGVNHVLNPVVYVQNIIGKDKYEPVVEVSEDAILFQLTEDVSENPYISFVMDCKEQYRIAVKLVQETATGEIIGKDIFLEDGVNVIKIEDEGITRIRLEGEQIKMYSPEITKAMQTPYAKVNLLKSLEICLSFVIIFVFWEGLQYIRTKYTVS